MDKEFYYLDGKVQKGPISVDQLKYVGLKSETLVWADGMENWKLAKDVSELAELIKKSPPPIPLIDNSKSSEIHSATVDSNLNIFSEDSDLKLWVTVKILTAISALFILVIFIEYSYINSKRDTLKNDISEQVNKIFNGKSVVSDGENVGVKGKLENTSYKKEAVKDTLDFMTFSPWWKKEGLFTIFKCSIGGFTVKKLTKISDESFDLETDESQDMGYRKSEYSRGITGFSYNENGDSNVYGNVRNYRISVQQYYNEAFDFLTKDDKTGAYTPGKFNDITNFSDITNEYFYIDNIAPTKYFTSGQHSISWESVGNASVVWDDAKVYYSVKGKHYEIVLNTSKFNNDLLIIIGLSIVFLLLITIVVWVSKPYFFRNLLLFGKRWENTLYPDQILFFRYSFFGTHKFTEILNETVSKGSINIIDKGNTINLSYSNKELFYKIEKIDKDNLTLNLLKDGSSLSFTRMGTKQKGSQ